MRKQCHCKMVAPFDILGLPACKLHFDMALSMPGKHGEFKEAWSRTREELGLDAELPELGEETSQDEYPDWMYVHVEPAPVQKGLSCPYHTRGTGQ